MPISDPSLIQLAQLRRLNAKICRRCGARNSVNATKCRKCRSKNLRLKRKMPKAKKK